MVESLASAIAAAHTQARTRWPGIVVDLATFSEEIYRRLGADVDVARLKERFTDDIYLAIACLAGDRTAIDHLEREFLTVIDSAARRTRPTDDQINEVRGQMRHNLFTADNNRESTLALFTGIGGLRGYLKVVAVNALVKAVNGGRRERPIDPLLDQLIISNATELEMLRAKYGEAVAESLRAAIASLDNRPRALLRYSLVERWSIDRIGELYDVNRSTAARWIERARDTLGDNIRKEVAQRCAIALSDVDSIVRNVQSQIDVSILRIL